MNDKEDVLTKLQPQSLASADSHLEDKFWEIKSLLDHLHPSKPEDLARQPTPQAEFENELAEVRLGTASGLYMSLRAKHAATAAHSVRVALGCSAWAAAMELSPAERDALEVAALLHDIGKIGVPDRILLKPSPLEPEEQAMMDRHWRLGVGILATCCNTPAIIENIVHAPAWFDGSRMRCDRDGAALPRGSRMLSIVDAFDSMMTAQVYRPAMSHERAIKELWDLAGKQFDPELVSRFSELFSSGPQVVQGRVSRRWLEELDRSLTNGPWKLQSPALVTTFETHDHFRQELLENMYDGVIFLDADARVTFWNRGAERLTGINGESMLQRPFTPTLLNLRDANGKPLAEEDRPFCSPLRDGAQSLRRVTIRGRNGKDVPIDAHSIPVCDARGVVMGISLLLHDASGQASLEERCQSLCEQVKHDPFTQLANRAEFDRVFAMFVSVHVDRHLPCSLVICDLDRFKHINDNYGHPAGDEVIRSFAQLLKSLCRPEDLVARYGGEEFVMLYADCDIATAASRAEEIRQAFSLLPLPALGNQCCTASFGATELQAGDDAETMLNRADRALLKAKEGGRNLVVQLGSGNSDAKIEKSRRRFLLWRTAPAGSLVDRQLVTRVPLAMALEKLRGFISDHQAEIAAVDDARVELIVNPHRSRLGRRDSDRSVPLLVELAFKEEHRTIVNSSGLSTGTIALTRVHLRIGLIKNRDRRRSNIIEQARLLTASVRSYLIADEYYPVGEPGMLSRATSLLLPWWGKKGRGQEEG